MGLKYQELTSLNYLRIKRIRPECCMCGIYMFEHIQKPDVTNIWSRRSGCKTVYYCDDCKCDVFGGVRLRIERKGD